MSISCSGEKQQIQASSISLEKRPKALKIGIYSALIGTATLYSLTVGLYKRGFFDSHNSNDSFKEESQNLLSGEELIGKLRGGGNVIFFRHFATDYREMYFDKARINHGTITSKELLESCDQQRPLSPYGRIQARNVGYGIKKLNIPISEVLTSPYCRVVEGTRLALEEGYTVQRDLIYRAVDFTSSMMKQHMHKEISKPFEENKVIFAHRTQMDDITHINEGEAFILEILPEGKFNLIGIVKPEEWALAALEPSVLGLGQVQEKFFSIKANPHIIERDEKEFKKLLREFKSR